MRNFDYSRLADQSWDMEVLSSLAKIHEYKGQQAFFPALRQAELLRLEKTARMQSTASSNKIEGIVTTGTRLKQLVEDRTAPRSRDESEILGYRNVLDTINESYAYIPLQPSYILQLHRDLLKIAGFSYAGSFKNVQNYINETLVDGTQLTKFIPLSPYETPKAVEAICSAYNRAIALEQVDPLLLIPAFISDFLCIHPFNDGNGRMSRLLTLLLLYQNGYEVGRYISIERQIERSKDAYYEALEKTDSGWYEGENDDTPFIKYMLQVILACYVKLEERVSPKYATNYDMVRSYVLGKVGKFTGADVMEACPGAGRSSVMAALKRLTEEGILVKLGDGRSTCYVRKDADKGEKV